MKKAIRQRLRELLAALPKEELCARSLAAAERLVAQPEFDRAQVLMAFLSLPSEVDTTPIILRAWQAHKRVAVPKVSIEQCRMLPVEIHALTDEMTQSDLGIREPVSGAEIPLPLIDLVIVPGLGFDRSGNRLGRGRGFYDRFLAHPEFRGVACALAIEAQVMETIPAEPLDRPVDLLVTDQHVYRFPPPRHG